MNCVLTTRSILLNQTACYYLVYAVDGVSAKDIGKKRIGDWSWNYYHSVALFRLAQYEISKGNASPKTMYELLESYVQRQIENEIISSKKVGNCKDELINLFGERVKRKDEVTGSNIDGTKESYYTSPYSYVYKKESTDDGNIEIQYSQEQEIAERVDLVGEIPVEIIRREETKKKTNRKDREQYLSALVNCRILYRTETKIKERRTEKQTEDTTKIIYYYHFCHILVYEYIMVEYILREIDKGNDNLNVSSIFLGEQDNTPDILEHTHLSSVLSMLLSSLWKMNENEENGNKGKVTRIEDILNELIERLSNFQNPRYIIDFLVLLSKIESDLSIIYPDFELNNAKINNKIEELLKEKNSPTLAETISLLRLYHGKDIDKTGRINDELDKMGNQEWIYLNSKRELLEEKMKSSLSKKVS